MQLTVMTAAERHGELVAHLQADGAGLGKAQVMRIAGLPAADQTGLRGDEPEVVLVAEPFGLGDRKDALVDTAGREGLAGEGGSKRRYRRRGAGNRRFGDRGLLVRSE